MTAWRDWVSCYVNSIVIKGYMMYEQRVVVTHSKNWTLPSPSLESNIQACRLSPTSQLNGVCTNGINILMVPLTCSRFRRVCFIRPDSIDLLFLGSSFTSIIKISQEKSRKQKIFLIK